LTPMVFAWKNYLELATVLKAQGEAFRQESCFRSATSRAYYAAYCHARNWASMNIGFVISNRPTDHERLRDHLTNRDKGDVAEMLDDMRKWRNQCDYRDRVHDPKLLAEKAIKEARRLWTLL